MIAFLGAIGRLSTSDDDHRDLRPGLKEIREHALSDKEPGCLLYYPARHNEDPLAFTVFEEYKDQEAIAGESPLLVGALRIMIDTLLAHMKSPVFQKFASDESVFEGGVKGLDIQYYTRL